MKNLFLFFFIILFLSCEVGEDFVPDNPIDPINPDYEKPEVEFISVPNDLEILQDPVFEFAWNGNAENMIYRFSFDGEWSEWEEERTSVTINHMDEGSHTFAVQSKYTNDDTSSVISSTFIVDAVKGSSLMIYPRKFSAESGQEFEIYLMAEEVSDLAAAEVQLSFDVSMIEIVDVEVGEEVRLEAGLQHAAEPEQDQPLRNPLHRRQVGEVVHVHADHVRPALVRRAANLGHAADLRARHGPGDGRPGAVRLVAGRRHEHELTAAQVGPRQLEQLVGDRMPRRRRERPTLADLCVHPSEDALAGPQIRRSHFLRRNRVAAAHPEPIAEVARRRRGPNPREKRVDGLGGARIPIRTASRRRNRSRRERRDRRRRRGAGQLQTR